MSEPSLTCWICDACERRVFWARVWHDGSVLCSDCNARQVALRHEVAEAIREAWRA